MTSDVPADGKRSPIQESDSKACISDWVAALLGCCPGILAAENREGRSGELFLGPLFIYLRTHGISNGPCLWTILDAPVTVLSALHPLISLNPKG